MSLPNSNVVTLPGRLGPRVDFDLRRFEEQIERSPRFVWEKACVCPCTPINLQTQQPTPSCSRCAGTGFFYFGPAGYVPDQSVDGIGPLDDVQLAAQQKNGGVIIRGFFAMAQYQQAAYDRLGSWVWGQVHVTVRPENTLGYYDRLVNLDSEVVYNQLVTADGTVGPLNLRYPAIEVTHVEAAGGTIYTCSNEFTVVGGDIVWNAGQQPAASTRLAVHYRCHPVWLVTDFPHVIRATMVRKRQVPTSQAGNPQRLPIRARVRLEFEQE